MNDWEEMVATLQLMGLRLYWREDNCDPWRRLRIKRGIHNLEPMLSYATGQWEYLPSGPLDCYHQVGWDSYPLIPLDISATLIEHMKEG